MIRKKLLITIIVIIIKEFNKQKIIAYTLQNPI